MFHRKDEIMTSFLFDLLVYVVSIWLWGSVNFIMNGLQIKQGEVTKTIYGLVSADDGQRIGEEAIQCINQSINQ